MKLGMSDVEMCKPKVPQKNKNNRKSSNSVPGVLIPELDWEQSPFWSKIRGEEHTTRSSRERASVMCEALN